MCKGLHLRRGVAPIIATLILIAITVVGGTIISLYTNEIFATAQISGSLSIELLEILGYDATDSQELKHFDDQFLQTYSGGLNDGKKVAWERVAVYVQNHSIQKVVINELRFAGTVYTFAQNVDTLMPYLSGMAPNRGEYVILLEAPDKLLDSSTPIIEAGQTVTLVIGLDDNIKMGRDGQVKITTNHGAVFLGTAKIGDQKS